MFERAVIPKENEPRKNSFLNRFKDDSSSSEKKTQMLRATSVSTMPRSSTFELEPPKSVSTSTDDEKSDENDRDFASSWKRSSTSTSIDKLQADAETEKRERRNSKLVSFLKRK